MKILFLLPSLTTGGLERVQVTIANALANRGHDVTVMTLLGDHALADMLDSRVRLIHKPFRPTIMKKIPYIRYKFYDDGLWETRATPKRLHRYYVGKEKYDVEIGFFRGLCIKIISGANTDFEAKSLGTKKHSAKRHNDFGAKSAGTRAYAWVHTDFEHSGGYKNNFKSMKDVFKAYSRFERVVCVSKQAENGFRRVIGDTGNLTTIYNMLPVEEIRRLSCEPCAAQVPRHKFNIVVVGRLYDVAKGQKRLISAVKSLRDEGLDIGLTLVGGGPDEALLREHIARLSAEDFVYMTGMQKNPYAYIKASDLLVCSSYFEGYNLTVAEALICGVPVMSTECTGPCEILDGGKYGMLVENSEDGIREGLRTLMTDRELLAHYRKAADERMEFFDEEKIIKQIEALWE